MRTIIAGSRDITDYDLVVKGIEDSHFDIDEIVSGGYRGVDALGERWAKENFVKLTIFNADWNTYGKAAGPMRNKKMVDYAEALIAFRLGDSRGTNDVIKQANKRGLRVYIIDIQ